VNKSVQKVGITRTENRLGMSHSDKRTDHSASHLPSSHLFCDVPVARLSENWQQAFPEIVGRSLAMSKVLETVAKISRSESSVLINGDSGTGKELIARAIHRLSSRAHKPFIAINCSAIPENLLESELFGHEKGAFTGAVQRHHGVFARAEGGTLFLDEIGDMAPSLQSKLLRVLQEKTFTPVGGKELCRADVRVIAATHVDLEGAIGNGSFRSDLYYRINVLPVTLPALRERREDIPLLLNHFIDVSNRMHPQQPQCWLTQEAASILSAQPWPGNIRQLQNLVERLVVLRGGGAICIEHLPAEFLTSTGLPSAHLSHPVDAVMPHIPRHNGPVRVEMKSDSHLKATSAFPPGTSLHELNPRPGLSAASVPTNFGILPAEGMNLIEFIENLENSLITQALQRTDNNRNQAARLLGMNRTTLVERIKKRKLSPMNPASEEL
jgi:sigma-54 dependent transcriptional regulator, flagellar regulatory protein